MSMVEWKKLVEVADILYGYPFESTLFTEDSSFIPLIRIRDVKPAIASTFYSGKVLDNYIIRKGDILVGMDGGFSLEKWNDRNGLLNQRVLKMTGKNSICESKYLYHYMKPVFKKIEKETAGGSVKHLSAKIINTITIPIPSLQEQERIVGILDTFTASIDNLKEQIAQRRKQYEHYRDQLLDLEGKEGVEMRTDEFCILKAGKSIKVDDIIDSPDNSIFPCFGGNGIRGYVPYYSHEGNYPIIGRQGALCGCVNWATGKFYATEHAVVASGTKIVSQRFLLHLFQHADLNQYKTQGAQPGLSVAKLNEVTFRIPSLSEQSRIVSLLDTFEASITNLEAQLREREKQYEYYRNKLLTFE